MSIRTIKAQELHYGMIVALPFNAAPTVHSLRVQGRHIVVGWEEDLPATRYEWDQEVLIEVPDSPASVPAHNFRLTRPAYKSLDSIVETISQPIQVEAGEDGESKLLEVLAPNGQRVGIQLNTDGSLTLGGWYEDGEWVELELRLPCHNRRCYSNHNLPFPLDQYKEEGGQ